MALGIHTLEFTGRDDVGGGAVALRFTPQRPLVHAAGQHALWRIPGGGVAPFTIASAPQERHVALATNAGTHSRLKRALAALRPGTRVRLAGPLSPFTLDRAGDDVVLLAQGIGITPFRSMLTDLGSAGAGPRTRLVHVGAGAGEFAGHAYRAETEALAGEARYPTGRGEFADHLARAAAATPDATYLISGSGAFVTATAAALAGHGVAADRVRRDTFHGWSGHRARAAA